MSNTITTQEDIEVYENDIFALCDSYIDSLPNKDAIYTNKGLVTDMLKYVYRNYVGDLIGNKDKSQAHRYTDIHLLDTLFNIYTSICYRYGKKPNMLEYSLFVGISRDTFIEWKNGHNRSLTPEYANTVKNWYAECENALLGGGSVFDIFLLKASYNYNDNLASIPIEQQNRVNSVEALPVLENVSRLEVIDND